jgi:hypothetical protein
MEAGVDIPRLEFNYSKFIAGLTICAFLLGVLYPLVYYSFFFFNVFDYIELAEIAIHVIKDGAYLLFPYLLFYYIGFVYSSNKDTAKTTGIPITIKYYKFFRFLVWTIAIMLFGSLIYAYIIDRISLPILLLNVMFFLYVYIVDIPKDLSKKILSKGGLQINGVEYFFMQCVVIIIYLGTMHGLIMADSVKNLHSTSGTYIIVNNKDTIKSNKTYYYIGRTNNYVFFYNAKNRFVDIFPEKDINKVSLH